jgi:hypothetical protein
MAADPSVSGGYRPSFGQCKPGVIRLSTRGQFAGSNEINTLVAGIYLRLTIANLDLARLTASGGFQIER